MILFGLMFAMIMIIGLFGIFVTVGLNVIGVAIEAGIIIIPAYLIWRHFRHKRDEEL